MTGGHPVNRFLRAPWVAGFGLAVAALAVYLLTMPRAITLEDAGLFQMVCDLGGIGHPPGYPLFTAGCQALGALPLDPVLRGNLNSALFAAVAVGLLFAVAREALGSLRSAALVAIVYALSDTFWSQSIIIEVYSLAVLMFLLTWVLVFGFVRTAAPRYWFGAAFCAGLGLANHWPLMMLSAPALVVSLWPAREAAFAMLRPPVGLLGTAACFIAGLAPYLAILLSANPVIAVYGPVQTVDELVGYIARRTYDDSHEGAVFVDKFRYAGWLLLEALRQFGLFLAPLVVLGAVVSVRRLPGHLALALGLMFLGSTILLALLIGFRYTFFYQAIFRPYPVIAFVACAFWLVIGIEWLLARLRLSERAHVALLALPLLVGVANLPGNNRAQDQFVDRYARAALLSLDADAIIFLNGDNQVGPLGFLHHVEGVRPDVELRDWENLVFRNRLGSPFAPPPQKLAAARRLISTTTRPVYSMEPLIGPAINFGLYYRFDPNGEGGVAFASELDRFLDYLLDVNEYALLKDSHERYHAYHLLIAYGRQYARHVMSGGAFDTTRRQRFERLKGTFPGKLMLLEAWNHRPWDEQDGAAMVGLAEAALPQVPIEANAQSLAVFKEFGARSYWRNGNLEQAQRWFVESVEHFPVMQNTSICALYTLLETDAVEVSEAATAVLRRFPGPSC